MGYRMMLVSVLFYEEMLFISPKDTQQQRLITAKVWKKQKQPLKTN